MGRKTSDPIITLVYLGFLFLTAVIIAVLLLRLFGIPEFWNTIGNTDSVRLQR